MVALRLGIAPNSIDNIKSTHTNPELFGHALIMEWLKNHEGSDREAINLLAMALRKSKLGSCATKLQLLDGQQTGLLQQHSLQSCFPACPSTQVLTLQVQILLPTLAQQVQISPHLVSQVQSTQASCQAELLQSTQVTSKSAQAQSPQTLSPSLHVRPSQVPLYLSEVKSPQSLPHFSTVPPAQSRGQLPVALQSANKEHKGCTQRDIAYILDNCNACEDFKVCKTALIKGIKRGLVTCHLRHDGCTGFKLFNLKHHNLKRRPTLHQRIYIRYHQTRTHQKITHLKCHLTLDEHMYLKRLLAHNRHRYFKLHRQFCHLKNRLTREKYICLRHHTENSTTKYGMRSRAWSNSMMVMSTPASVCGRDITAPPIPFPTPSGDDMTIPDYTPHLTSEAPDAAHHVTDSPTPFLTPNKDDDIITPPNHGAQQMYIRRERPKVAEEKLKVFFITALGRRDSNTIALVGRSLVGDEKYKSIVEREHREPVKKVVDQVFEEWKKQEGDINFHKLLKTFRAIDCNELVKEAQVFIQKQGRLFSNDQFVLY